MSLHHATPGTFGTACPDVLAPMNLYPGHLQSEKCGYCAFSNLVMSSPNFHCMIIGASYALRDTARHCPALGTTCTPHDAAEPLVEQCLVVLETSVYTALSGVPSRVCLIWGEKLCRSSKV